MDCRKPKESRALCNYAAYSRFIDLPTNRSHPRSTRCLLNISDVISQALGTPAKATRYQSLFLCVLLTGLAVAVAGPVGMVALIGPEIARTLNRNRGIPLVSSVLCGAILMTLANLAGRALLSPLEIPVGIVTAIVGSPVLINLHRTISNQNHTIKR